jgi:hypothetical protein
MNKEIMKIIDKAVNSSNSLPSGISFKRAVELYDDEIGYYRDIKNFTK